MQMECPKLNFQIVKLEKEGICLRFAPLECAQGNTFTYCGFIYFHVLEGEVKELLDNTKLCNNTILQKKDIKGHIWALTIPL